MDGWTDRRGGFNSYLCFSFSSQKSHLYLSWPFLLPGDGDFFFRSGEGDLQDLVESFKERLFFISVEEERLFFLGEIFFFTGVSANT